MKKIDVVARILEKKAKDVAQKEQGLGYAPTNVAVCKYWGKRNEEINLPMTSSLSVALPNKGAGTHITWYDGVQDAITLNGETVDNKSGFAHRLIEFLDLFRETRQWCLRINITMNLPVGAGLASSACGFASLVLALNDLFSWQLSLRDLSILARLGSGSASRSMWTGFVEWVAGFQEDGMDSYGEPLPFTWPELNIGILSISDKPKPISSREAMQRTVNSSALYANWPRKVTQDLIILKQAMRSKNFPLFAGTAESNALSMHATMLSSWPPICYFLPETIAMMHKIWELRQNGLNVYFTEDAGPNLKLIFLEKDAKSINEVFPHIDIVKVFEV